MTTIDGSDIAGLIVSDADWILIFQSDLWTHVSHVRCTLACGTDGRLEFWLSTFPNIFDSFSGSPNCRRNFRDTCGDRLCESRSPASCHCCTLKTLLPCFRSVLSTRVV